MSKVVVLRSNPIEPDPRVEKIVYTLLKNRYSVKLIAWERNDTKTKKFIDIHGFSVPIKKIKIHARFGGGFKSNIFPLIKWQFNLMKELVLSRKDYEIIHACDFDTVLPAIICKILFRKKVIYDIFDFYVEAFNVPKTLKNFIKKIDFWMINNSSGVIITNESRIMQIEGSHPKKLIVVHNTPIISKDKLLTKESEETIEFKISYVGILQDFRFIKEMVSIVKSHPHWQLKVAGFGKYEDYLRSMSRENSNIIFLGKVDYQQSINISKESDLLFAIYDPVVPNHKYSSPNKLYEAMALSKPIIVAKNTGVDLLVEKENIGLTVDYYNISKVEESLGKLANDKELLDKLGRNASKVYHKKYSWSIMEKRLISLYEEISNEIKQSR